MLEVLRQNIFDSVASAKPVEVDEILAVFSEKELKKGEFLKEPFCLGTEVAFIVEGTVRLVIYTKKGDDITARIRQKGSFIIDPYRLKGKDTSPLGIECIEDVSVLIAPVSRIQELLESNLALNILIRKYLTEQLLDVAETQYLFLTGSAKERYQHIIEKHPELVRKFPLRFISSMIGITPTQLSRVRKKS